ncbi:Na+/H+ antiporter subunit E [Corynebacterium hansenii]|uniref:Na+/H+ antiporter subunit E n=1 Tax=Corynebacterium hansenii TaxID=394964 RepID=A0ABV7ZPL5_9CORY|nr:Na+/H+ antiporter subunit E [Corynebacterium hansenii]WJY98838.1 putative monovalent cation/H+ antiporter subunit E [Corynebacterium hansenii]
MSFLHIPLYSAWLVGQVISAATDVLVDAVRPRQKQKPILIGMPLRITTDNEIVGLSASITMTPGTLVCGTRSLEGGGRMFIVHVMFGEDLEAAYDALYDMEERMAPRVRDLPRPRAFVFEGYDATMHADPGARVGTAAETRDGLPDLPDGIRVVDDPMEEDVIPEQTADHRGGADDPTVDVVTHDSGDPDTDPDAGAAADRRRTPAKEADHE